MAGDATRTNTHREEQRMIDGDPHRPPARSLPRRQPVFLQAR